MTFDGKVAIVTGAGGQPPSLGRSHAEFLAARGAKIVVNDLGVGPDGRSILRSNAEQVVDDIRAAGGQAVADTHSVADESSAREIVQTALDTWGRLDILINNAGVAHIAHFDEISSADIRNVIDVHLMGTLWMCRAAWSVMRNGEYGRIVNTTSGGMFGQENLSIYGAAKGGIFGLTRSLAIEGAAHGIKVNALGPAANTTAMHHLNEACDFNTMMQEHFPVELVSPAAAYLAHEECEVSGAYLEVGAGNVATRVFGVNAGFHDAALTTEAVRDNLAAIVDKSTTTVIPDFWEASPGTGEAALLGIVPKPYEAV